MPDSDSTTNAMRARIHVITLGVSDLERSLAFYRDGLGLPSPGITGTQYVGDEHSPAGSVAMFTLEDGLVLSLYPRTDLAMDAGLEGALPRGSAMSIGHIVDNRDDVDRVLGRAQRAGARLLGAAHDRPWGIYSGYFADPDDHLWEVIHFPPREAAP